MKIGGAHGGISVGPDVAHGIPGDRVVQAGDLINIDVSAELDGFFGDTGATKKLGHPSQPRRSFRLADECCSREV